MKRWRHLHKLTAAFLLAAGFLCFTSCQLIPQDLSLPSWQEAPSFGAAPEDSGKARGSGQACADTSPEAFANPADGIVEVHVLDVGQGLSVFVRSKDCCLLYDGGRETASSFVVSYLKRQGVEKLDYVIASHYDSDHLSGIVGVISAFPIGTLIAPDYEADSPVYRSFLTAAAKHRLSIVSPAPGTEYLLGDGTFRILAPLGADYEDENDYSVVVKLSLGDTSLLLTGDAAFESEEEMLSHGDLLESDVLLIGHHGSAGSTKEEFLTAVSPDFAVISCGLGNDYGHPSDRVVSLLEESRIPLYRTDLQGNIDFVLQPEGAVFAEPPCSDYTCGRDMSLDDSDFNPHDYVYILNTRTHKFHLPDCGSVADMSAKNRRGSNRTREDLLRQGYDPCGVCRP